MSTRRLALGAAVLLQLLLAVQSSLLLEEAQQTWDVIVVGAGMAGVAAARNLTDAGNRVLVLEGRERAGGRLQSTRIVGGGDIDTGGMWIHEAVPGNALYDLIRAGLQLPMSPRQGMQDYSSQTVYGVDGEVLSRAAFSAIYPSWFSQFQSALRAQRSGAAPDRALLDVYQAWLAGNPRFGAADMRRANVLLHTNYQSLLNGNVSALSTARLGDAKSIPAVDQMVTAGFPAVVDALTPGLDIRYGVRVTAVEQGADSVIVTAANGTRFAARYALVTPSLGCLKAGNISFVPPLPEAKAAAIRDMGYGVLDKVVFVFKKPFWPNSDFLLSETDLSGRWAIFLNYHKLQGWPALAAIHVADTARALEALTDEEVVAEGLAALRRMYGAAAVGAPLQTNVTRWAADPYSLGSYSFFAVGNPKNITAALAEPTGRVLWAGEATSNKPATVLGAYLSGLREAARLQELLRAEGAAPAAEAAA